MMMCTCKREKQRFEFFFEGKVPSIARMSRMSFFRFTQPSSRFSFCSLKSQWTVEIVVFREKHKREKVHRDEIRMRLFMAAIAMYHSMGAKNKSVKFFHRKNYNLNAQRNYFPRFLDVSFVGVK
jgi:hypothetical protein